MKNPAEETFRHPNQFVSCPPSLVRSRFVSGPFLPSYGSAFGTHFAKARRAVTGSSAMLAIVKWLNPFSSAL